MNQDDDTSVEISGRRRVYSAPRRFDLSTLFVVMIVYACVLGLFVGLNLTDAITFSVLGFFTLVAIGQPLLFGGRAPRLASVIAGGVLLPMIVVLLNFFDDGPLFMSEMMTGVVFSVPLGAVLGYLAGALVGGVFLLADVVRQGRGVVD